MRRKYTHTFAKNDAELVDKYSGEYNSTREKYRDNGMMSVILYQSLTSILVHEKLRVKNMYIVNLFYMQ